MKVQSNISRRQFVGSAISAAALSSLPIQNLLVSSSGDSPNSSNADWKDEGILFVDKSPFAKLHNIPVHAVTITQGFWGARRQVNVDKSIPSMEKLLEANGRMDNFLRLVGESDAQQRGLVCDPRKNALLKVGNKSDLGWMSERIYLRPPVAGGVFFLDIPFYRTCYSTSLYVNHFKHSLNSGEAQLLNRIFKNYLALPNEARLERGDKAIPMRPKKSANGVKWTPVVDSQPEAHAW